ncbi:MAG TPA: phage portal protein [Thermomicrobiales bacterium]|nr:phage portal protein [Thermomicrobiales bacterium]
MHHTQLQLPLPGALDGRDIERMNRYRTYLDFYSGQQWTGRRRAGETRLTFNYARTLIQKSASYLFPRPVTFNVIADGDGQEQAVQRAERALNGVYSRHDQHTIDFQSALDSAVLGDGAFKVTWSARRAAPLVVPVDPASLWAWWEPDNPNEVYRVVQRYTLASDEASRLFPGARVPEPWGSNEQLVVVEDWDAERYTVTLGGEEVINNANPYGFIPYVIYPNVARPHEFWGASDLEDLVDVCRELNQRMTTLSRILHVAGYPITVLENVTGSDGIRAEAGAIWELPEDSKAYLLDMLGSGVGLHIDYVNLLYRQLHDLSETPRTAFGDSGRALSGVALEVEIQPLIQKVMRKRRVWDAVYRKRNAMILALLEQYDGLDINGLRRTEAVWGEILPSDREVLVRSEAQLVAAGIHSHQQAMSQLGDTDPTRTWSEVLDERSVLGVMGDG